MLRDTWERAVEEVLFANTVLRFRKGVETQRLKEVEVTDDDYRIIEQGMSKCSTFCHDAAPAAPPVVPAPNELLADIQLLESWREDVEKRKAGVSKQRSTASPRG